jgi:hypothetical protein
MHRRTLLGSSLATVISSRLWGRLSEVSTDAGNQSLGGIPAEAVSVVYNAESSAESAAGKELQEFIRRMTGKSPKRHTESGEAAAGLRPAASATGRGAEDNGSLAPQAETALFLVGRTPATAQLISSGTIPDPGKKHPEAYLVRPFAAGKRKGLVFLGGTGIATLYAVYHYLEEYCGVGFFFDGDHISRREQVPVTGVDVFTQPRFPERMTMNLTLYWYATPWWEWEDWKR